MNDNFDQMLDPSSKPAGKKQTVDDILFLLRKYQPYNKLHGQAADEIERLRQLAKAMYEETKKCGPKHDVKATNDWEDYEQAVRGD